MSATSLRRSARIQTSSSIVVSSFHSSSLANYDQVTAEVPTTRARKKLKISMDEGIVAETKTKNNTTRTRKPKGPQVLPIETYPKRVVSDWKVGAHVSAAGGVENTILNAASIGANAFALFVKSQRKWSSSPLTQNSIKAFHDRLKDYAYQPDFILPHGSYLINLGNPDLEKREKSYTCFIDDLKRCEALGLTKYNFHPGSTVGVATKEESIAHIASCINRAHKETSSIITVIENMAGSGNILGSKFEEIAAMIELVEDKSRVGVCLDTCHTFAGGYDIRSKDEYEKTLSEFDRIVGLRYLQGMHINGSKADLASHKDRHDNIGRGKLPLAVFRYIMRDERLRFIPLILETPTEDEQSVWQKEIEVLYELSSLEEEDTAVMKRLSDDIADVVGKAAKEQASKKTAKKNKGETSPTKRKSTKRARVEEKEEEEEEEEEEEGNQAEGREEYDNRVAPSSSPLSSLSS